MLSLAAVGLSGAAGCAPVPAVATPPARPVPRLGYLTSYPPDAPGPDGRSFVESFREGLREQGYVEGETILVEYRFASGDYSSVPALAEELVRLPVDVLVVGDGQSITAARQATTTIPIVVTLASDPVRAGWAASARRPGGNATGLMTSATGLMGKRLEFLKELLPGISSIAALANPDAGLVQAEWKELREAAERLGISVIALDVRGRGDLGEAFHLARLEGAEALQVFPDALLNQLASQIAEFAVDSRLPSIGPNRDYAQSGGLMSYAPDRLALFRRAAAYVQKIVQGANAGELPLEGPTHFEFVINLKTAQALGITIPRTVLLDATDVIR
jgi:putative ABC transport system substrate-binding protein